MGQTYTNPTGTFNGTTGDDTLIYNLQPSALSVIDADLGRDSLIVNFAASSGVEYSADDLYNSGEFQARIIPGSYDPQIIIYKVESVDFTGTVNNDRFSLRIAENSGALSTRFDGGAGVDFLNLDTAQTNRAITFIVSAQGISSNAGTFLSLERFEIHTGDGNDVIQTADLDDVINSSGGSDQINAGGGNDQISTTSGGDTVDGGAGFDYFSANYLSSTVALTVNIGSVVTISNGTIATNVEAVNIATGLGNDSVTVSRAGQGTVSGGAGRDTLTIAIQAGQVFDVHAYSGSTFYGSVGDMQFNDMESLILSGGAQDDQFSVTGIYSGADLQIDGGAGIDSIYLDLSHFTDASIFEIAGDGSITSNRGQFSGLELFTISGGSAADVVRLSDGLNYVYGLGGNDILSGGASADRLYGGQGDDQLAGSAGDDVLVGDQGADRIDGGSGIDTVDYEQEGQPTSVRVNIGQVGTAGPGGPVLAANQAIDTYGTIDSLISIENVTTGGGNDYILANDEANVITAGGGDDYIDGRGGSDILVGGAGVDIMTGGAGGDTFAGLGDDFYFDTITDFGVGDRILITDATLSSFTFGLVGETLTFDDRVMTLTGGVSGTLVASAASGGGVQLTIQAIVPPPPINDVRNDFNGDGRSDILWRSTTGQLSDWIGTANGGFVGNDANAFASVPTSWTIVGTGDFNGDGRDDVLWRNSNGQLSDWLGTANGGFIPNDANALTTIPTNWSVVGTGDFNGDGRDDILWRNTAGQLSDWLGTATGGFTPNDANAFTSVPTNWHVAGTGDFNGDGRDDILWRNDAGQLSDWLGQANGGFVGNDANAFASAPTSWNIVGTGDFNGDGRDDILWRSNTGQLSNWLGQANGGFVGNDANAFTTVPTSWTVVAVGDYNGDGRDDILWRNTNGQLSNWLGNANGGFTPNDANASTNVPTNWHVQAEHFIL